MTYVTRMYKVTIVCILALLILGGNTITSTVVASSPYQEDGSEVEVEDAGTDSVTPVPPLETPELPQPAEGEEEVSASSEEFVLAVPQPTMNYQGYLTNASGAPLNATYDMVFSLWNASAGGSKRWGDETHSGVIVQDGLFQVALGSIVALYPYNLFDEQLYLQVVVDGTTLPRQPLRATPYAMGLTIGARAIGSTTSDSHYGLYVSNEGGRGIYANGMGNSAYGIYNADVTYSDDGYAGPDTYLWLPAMDTEIKYADRNDAHLEVQTYGDVCIESDANNRRVDIEIPIQIDVPHGRPFKVTSATIYYKANATGWIDWTWVLGRNFSTGATIELVSNTTDRKSTSFTSYTVSMTDNQDVTTAMAPTNLQLALQMDTTAGQVCLYGVRLRLDSTY